MTDLLVAGTGGSSPEYVCIVYISIKCFKVNISSETNSQKILFQEDTIYFIDWSI